MLKHKAEQTLNEIVDAVVESGHPAADKLIQFRDDFVKPTNAEKAIGKLSQGMGSPAVFFGRDISMEEAIVELALGRMRPPRNLNQTMDDAARCG